MLRWMMPLAIALFAIPPAEAADVPGAAVKAPPTYVRVGRQLVVVEPKVVVVPLNSEPYIPYVPGEPLLPGSSSLPGYYGNSRSYSYLGPYYGGAYVDYWDRLPYACGVYGYC